MTKQIPIVNTSTDTFANWVTRTNDIINTVNTEVITANTTVGVTIGNAFVVGIFGSNTVCAQTAIRGGNVTTSNVLSISSNVKITSDALYFTGNNIVINSTAFVCNSVALLPVMLKVAANTAGFGTQLIDEFSMNSYSGCDYSFVIKDTTALSNAYQISRLALIHNTISVYGTEYGVMHTNTSLGTFSTSNNGSNAALYFTPTVANTQISGIKTVIEKI